LGRSCRDPQLAADSPWLMIETARLGLIHAAFHAWNTHAVYTSCGREAAEKPRYLAVWFRQKGGEHHFEGESPILRQIRHSGAEGSHSTIPQNSFAGDPWLLPY